jgi:Tfp pilus assembly protein PilX
MSSGTIVAVVVVVIIVVALLAFAPAALRRRRLQQRFGPEYDRAVADAPSRREAEADLAEREKRVRSLDIRPLDAPTLNRYALQWNVIQEQFVDAPANSVTSAQSLITAVMNDRGYPTEDSGQIMADLSVDYARTIEEFRTAQELSGRVSSGTASTEDLRQAMVHYRSLFRELLGEPAQPADAAAAVTSNGAVTHEMTPPDGTPIPRTGTDPASAYPADTREAAAGRDISAADAAEDASVSGHAAEDVTTNGAGAPSPASAARLPQER